MRLKFIFNSKYSDLWERDSLLYQRKRQISWIIFPTLVCSIFYIFGWLLQSTTGYCRILHLTIGYYILLQVTTGHSQSSATIITQQYPTTEYCHLLIIVNQKTFFSSLIQNMIYKLIVQTFVPKTSKFV